MIANMNTGDHQLSPKDVKALIKAKNWSVSNIAFRWNITRETVSRYISMRNRPTSWTDMLRGLPKITRLEAREISKARMEAATRRVKRAYMKPLGHSSGADSKQAIFEERSILIAMEPIGIMADEGDEGTVVSVFAGSTGWFYKINWPDGADIFPEAELVARVADSGRTAMVI